MTEHTPSCLELLHILRGHSDSIYEIAWSGDGRWLASCSVDRVIRIWDIKTLAAVQTLQGHDGAVLSVAWSRDGRQLVSGSTDRTVRLWDVRSGKLVETFEDHSDKVYSVAWQSRGGKFVSGSADGTVRVWDSRARKLLKTFEVPPGEKVICVGCSPKRGNLIASGSSDGIVRIWDGDGNELKRLQGHTGQINTLAWEPQGRLIASGSVDRSVRLWDSSTGLNLSVLENHTRNIECVRFSPDGKLLASKAADDTVRLWWCNARVLVETLSEPVGGNFLGGLAFHPGGKMLATLGEGESIIRIWQLDLPTLKTRAAKSDTRHYRNAKVVLVGDPGVGKSGLALRLRGEEFGPTKATHGRQVSILESTEVKTPDGYREIRETILWDLGGQPGYRLIHQLHLHEAAVALVVFDSQRWKDPFGGVYYWDRALRQARSPSPEASGPLKKFLVASRAEHGIAGKARIEALVQEMGFAGYFVTSAEQNWQIDSLRAALRTAIEWERLPQVSSTRLFHTIREFLLSSREPGRLLVSMEDFFQLFCAAYPLLAGSENLRDSFDTCITRLEEHGLIRRFSFGGGLLLLKPEQLDSYASAIVIAAEQAEEPGVLRQEDVFEGNFLIPGFGFPPEQVKLLLRATVEELISYELVLREQTESGPYLVFPSEFCRDWPEAPDPRGKVLSFTFEGPTLNIYTTLVFRLAHSGSFAASRKQIWLNAVIFDTGNGDCGLYRQQKSEGKDELFLFFAPTTPPAIRFQFEEFVGRHLQERAIPGTLSALRFRTCPKCGHPLPEEWIACPLCGERVPAAPAAKPFPSMALEMGRRVRQSREYEAWELAASAEIEIQSSSPDMEVAIVFTDVVGSTALQSEVGDERIGVIQEAHFRQVRLLVTKHKGMEIKTLGDSFLATFPTAALALEFALELYCDTGHKRIAVRIGIHVVITTRIDNDIFGSAVNYAARVCGMAAGAEIWLSDRAYKRVDQKALRHENLPWQQYPDRDIRGMPGQHTLWSLSDIPCKRPPSALTSGLDSKLRAGNFDVFLCYNSIDRPAVKEIAGRLAERGIRPWFDEWEARPGSDWVREVEERIPDIGSAAVFVGREGLGPWQRVEMATFLREFVTRQCAVIPVLLPGCPATPQLPLFLQGFVWVDFSDAQSGPLERLMWGITGERQAPE